MLGVFGDESSQERPEKKENKIMEWHRSQRNIPKNANKVLRIRLGEIVMENNKFLVPKVPFWESKGALVRR